MTGIPRRLTSDDIATYQALTATPSVETERGAAPRPHAESVERLTRLGLITTDADPVPPESAVASHVHDALDATRVMDDAVSTMLDASQSLHVLNEQLPQLLAPHASAVVEVLTDETQVRERVVSMLGSAQQTVLGMHPQNNASARVLDAGVRAHHGALQRGVEVRSLHLRAGLMPRQLNRLSRLVTWGVTVRLRSTLPFRMLLVDGTVALCSPPSPLEGNVVVVRGAHVMRLLEATMETLWADAVPLHSVEDLPAPALNRSGELEPEQRHLSRLLAEGLSDRSIARHLGIAERTVTRRVTQLFESLEVSTRFQAGAEAARRGLI